MDKKQAIQKKLNKIAALTTDYFCSLASLETELEIIKSQPEKSNKLDKSIHPDKSASVEVNIDLAIPGKDITRISKFINGKIYNEM